MNPVADAPCKGLICAEDLPASGQEPCLANVTQDGIEQAIEEATYLLYRLSGRRVYGLCEATVRPCARRCGGVASCRDHLSIRSIRLAADAQRILWIAIDGEMLDPTSYVLLDGALLVREGKPWPHCQDIDKPWTEEGTFAIHYEYGTPIDPATKRAAVDLTVDIIKRAIPGADTALPPNTTSVSRRGVALSMQDRNEILEGGSSYIESVNQFIALHNPNRQPPTYVHSPDRDHDLHSHR